MPTLCIFGDAGTEPLLGAITLEAFLLAADPHNKRLVPVTGYLKKAAVVASQRKDPYPC